MAAAEEPRVLSIDVGTRNLGIWVGSWIEGDAQQQQHFRTHHWELMNLHAHTASIASDHMVEQFLTRPWLYDPRIAAVLIESQEYAVPLMQRLSNAIQAHFLTIVRTDRFPGYEPHVSFASGPGKLRVYTGGKEFAAPTKTRSTRKRNKWLGERHCRELLRAGGERDAAWLDWWRSLAKKDDVSDAYLQGAWYLYRTNRSAAKRKRERESARPAQDDEDEEDEDEDEDEDDDEEEEEAWIPQRKRRRFGRRCLIEENVRIPPGTHVAAAVDPPVLEAPAS